MVAWTTADFLLSPDVKIGVHIASGQLFDSQLSGATRPDERRAAMAVDEVRFGRAHIEVTRVRRRDRTNQEDQVTSGFVTRIETALTDYCVVRDKDHFSRFPLILGTCSRLFAWCPHSRTAAMGTRLPAGGAPGSCEMPWGSLRPVQHAIGLLVAGEDLADRVPLQGTAEPVGDVP